MPDRPSTGQANQRAPHAGDRRSYPVLIDLHLQPVLNNANQACPGLRGALPVTGPQSWGHQSAAGGRVRHIVPSVSRRPEESLVHINMPLEGGSDTQCNRFHGDSRTVLGISVCCWREGQTQTPSTGLRHPSFRKLPVSDARSVGQTHSAIGFMETREQSCGHTM